MGEVNKKVGNLVVKERVSSYLAEALSLSRVTEKFRKVCLGAVLWMSFSTICINAEDAREAFHLGPIYDRVPTVFQEGERTEILGPLLSLEATHDASLFTISPL